jgi:hypothetical protein
MLDLLFLFRMMLKLNRNWPVMSKQHAIRLPFYLLGSLAMYELDVHLVFKMFFLGFLAM